MSFAYQREIHYKDFEYNWYSATHPIHKNTTIQTLNFMDMGPGVDERTGRHATVLGLEVRGTLSLPAVLAGGVPGNGWDRVRIILLEDSQKNGSETFTHSPLSLYPGLDWKHIDTNSFYNPEGFGRFRVLLDKSYTLAYTAVTGDTASGVVTHISESLPMDIKVTYTAPTAPSGVETNRFGNISSKNIMGILLSETKLVDTELNFRTYFSGVH